MLEVAQGAGLSRNRLTGLELGKFDRVANDELTALSTYYTKALERPIRIGDILEIDANSRRAYVQPEKAA